MTLNKKQKTGKNHKKNKLDEEHAATIFLADIEDKLEHLDKDRDADKIELLNQISQLFDTASLSDVFHKVGRESLDKDIKRRHQLWLDLLLAVKIETIAKIVNDEFSKQDVHDIKEFLFDSMTKLFDDEFTKIFKANFAISIEDVNRKRAEVELAKINLAESTRKLNMLYDPTLKTVLAELNKNELTAIHLQELKTTLLATKNIIDELVPIIAVPFYQTKDQGMELQLELDKINSQIEELNQQLSNNKKTNLNKTAVIAVLETITALKEKVLPFVIVSCDHIENELTKMHDEISMLLLMRIGALETDKNTIVARLDNQINMLEANKALIKPTVSS